MFSAVADVLQLIVGPCYELTGNWWAAILLFTLATKVILVPMSLWVQWNSIKMVQIMPALNRLKAKFYGDREAIGERQSALYKQAGYHPLLSLVPLAIQIVILFGLVDVIHSITDSGTPGTEFLGLVPVEDGGLSWLMPVLAGASAVALGFAQNRINPLQREQSRAEKNLTNGLSIGLSLVLGVFVAAGMAFYWICSNLSAIAVQALMNVVMPPAKHIDYDDLARSRIELAELDELSPKGKRSRLRRDPLAVREKADYQRFFQVVGKHIVFYSEGSGFFKYFKGAIVWLLQNSDATVHYVTNDPDDQVFALAESLPRIRPYYIGPQRAITLMMKMDADVVVTTLEDLETYHIKRSYVRKDVEYVFMMHHMTSMHLTPHKDAYDHYDTILCSGPHQVAEVRRAEDLYGLPRKRLVETGYDLLDEEVASYEAKRGATAALVQDHPDRGGEDAQNGGSDGPAPDAVQANGAASANSSAGVADATAPDARPTVLIGPSWQEGNVLDSCFDELMEGLLGRGWRVVVRPHPEYTKRFAARWEALKARWAHVGEDELFFERDFSSNETIWTSDVLVTDWSSVSCEFAFSTLKPCIFVDTPMKVGNPDWEELGLVPTDISLRNQVGVSLAPEKAAEAGDVAAAMLADPQTWAHRIREVREGFVFNLGHGAEAAGEYLLEAILRAQAKA